MNLRYLGIVAERAYSDSPEELSSFRVVRVQDGKPTQIAVFPKNGSYKKCVIAGTSFQTRERAHIVKNNGVVFGTFFDSDIEMLSVQGALFSSKGDPWDMAMQILWENLMRATKLAQIGCILEFYSGGVVYYCYPISFACASSATAQSFINFQMQLAIWKKILPEKMVNLDEDVARILANPPKGTALADTLSGITPEMMADWAKINDKMINDPVSEIKLPGSPT